MSNKFDLRDLVDRSKEGKVTAAELREVANLLASGQKGPDTYQLLYVISRSGARAYEDLVAGFVEYSEDPMVARLALQTLGTFWGLAGSYRDVIVKFLRGVEWDYFGDVRQVAITAAGEFLAYGQDCGFLDQLIQLSNSGADDEVERLQRRIAVEALARAVGVPLGQAINADKGAVTWEAWAEEIISRGRERFSSECT